MARQNYGASPWGKWFIDILNSYGMDARLDRGRSYANTGKVLSLDIQEGKALAKVKGNYRPFYKVEISFPPLAEKERVLALIEEDPSLLARITAGELPEEFLRKLQKEGVELIPRRWKDMRRSCTCPDWGDPCKHMAALYYIIAREIDADPHILFRLRGLDLEKLTKRFGASLNRELKPPFAVEAAAPARKTADKTAHNGEDPPIGDSARAGQAGRPESPPEWADIPRCTELILSLLPPAPAFSARNFTVTLGEFYHHTARFVPWESAGDGGDAEERLFSHSRWTLECPDPRPGAAPVLLREGLTGETERYSTWEAFVRFRLFSSDDGTENYTFL
ncbi:MAG: SWIM zinc finger family protein, partial [Treponema sp.]|nr:SWIM zinc finger family protein [Treponema sp.]